jgi:Sulfotransferase family
MRSSLVDRLKRKLRCGRPIVVVSGLPRSGTSMAMMMLKAGGMPLLTDAVRLADESNPNGYFEFEPVKQLDSAGDLTWLDDAGGRAVKIISFLLTWLPESHDYQVVFMHRDLDEVIASQQKMLGRRGEPAGTAGAGQMREIYARHLEQAERFLANRRCFTRLAVSYRNVVERPDVEARRINDFLGGRLDVERMAAVADRRLYRNRRE